MRVLVHLCLAIAAGLAAFAYWGMWTVAGRTAYDEMDGLYPLGASILAGLLVVIALALHLFSRRRR